MASGEIDEKAVYQCTGNPLPQDVEQIATWLFNEDFATCFNSAALVLEHLTLTSMAAVFTLKAIMHCNTLLCRTACLLSMQLPKDVKYLPLIDIEVETRRGESRGERGKCNECQAQRQFSKA